MNANGQIAQEIQGDGSRIPIDEIPRNRPIALTGERAWRTYLGGRLIDGLHGMKEGADGHFPEEWIASLVWARNAGREHLREGLSRLAECPELSLAQLVNNDPEGFLGKAHAAEYGTSMGVLVKLIDAAERLTVQVHPDRRKAQELFSSDYGKTECWHILGGRSVNGEAPCVYLGFKEGITREYWQELFCHQDIPAMLSCMHRFEVTAGDTIFIEGGVPHAIGAGCFLAEIQEPTDYTIRIERTTPAGFAVDDFMCHQGLGFDRMFECFHYKGLSEEETRSRWFVHPEAKYSGAEGTVVSLIGPPRTDFFAMEMIWVDKNLRIKLPDSFSGIYVLEGRGLILPEGSPASFEPIHLEKGRQFFLPAGMETLSIGAHEEKPLQLLHFFGPGVRA